MPKACTVLAFMSESVTICWAFVRFSLSFFEAPRSTSIWMAFAATMMGIEPSGAHDASSSHTRASTSSMEIHIALSYYRGIASSNTTVLVVQAVVVFMVIAILLVVIAAAVSQLVTEAIVALVVLLLKPG